MILDDLDLMVQIFLEFFEPKVHDAATPHLCHINPRILKIQFSCPPGPQHNCHP
jgi:hypothetical protein